MGRFVCSVCACQQTKLAINANSVIHMTVPQISLRMDLLFPRFAAVQYEEDIELSPKQSNMAIVLLVPTAVECWMSAPRHVIHTENLMSVPISSSVSVDFERLTQRLSS